MNRAHRIIWCNIKRMKVVVAESASARGRGVAGGKAGKRPLLLVAGAAACMAFSLMPGQLWADNAVCVNITSGGTLGTASGINSVACGQGATASSPNDVFIGNGAGVGFTAKGTVTGTGANPYDIFDSNSNPNYKVVDGKILRTDNSVPTAEELENFYIHNNTIQYLVDNTNPSPKQPATNNNIGLGTNAGKGSSGYGNVVMGNGASQNYYGQNSITIGAGANSYSQLTRGFWTVAIGDDARASADAAVAMGNRAQANAGSSVAVGSNAKAQGTNSTALGAGANATALAASAFGSGAYATQDSNAFGRSAASYGQSANSFGYNASAAGGGQAVGRDTVALGNATVVGNAAAAASSGATFGNRAGATANHSTAVGTEAIANTWGDIALGAGASADGMNIRSYSSMQQSGFGERGNTDSSSSGIAVGVVAKSQGKGSIVVGSQSNAVGDHAVVSGFKSTAWGDNTVAMGNESRALGTGNIAIGQTAIAGTQVDTTQLGNALIAWRSAEDKVGTARLAYLKQQGVISQKTALGTVSQADIDTLAALAEDLKSKQTTLNARKADATALVNATPVANAIAIGKGAQALGSSSISIGTGNVVRGNNSGAFGDPSIINGANSYSVGNNNTIGSTTNNAFALGNNVYLGATSAGVDTTSVSGAVALGNATSVTQPGGVALGENSAASIIAGVQGYDPLGSGKAQSTATLATGTWKATNAAISVGKADGTLTRQITGVAAGTASSDAVNVAQLKAAQTHYYSVNSTATGVDSNYNNDGATGLHSLAAGVRAAAAGQNSVSVGFENTVSQTASLLSADSTALGQRNTIANSSNSILLGANNRIETSNSVSAIGGGNVASGSSASSLTAR